MSHPSSGLDPPLNLQTTSACSREHDHHRGKQRHRNNQPYTLRAHERGRSTRTMRHNKRPVPRRVINTLGHPPATRRHARQLVPKRGQDIRAPPRGAEDDLPPAAGGYDEGAGLVVEREAVRVRAHALGHLAVQAGLAHLRVGELARAAEGRVARGRARRQARVEDGPLDPVVRVRVDAVARLDGGVHLQVPGAPAGQVLVGEARLPGRRVRGVGVGLARPRGRPEEARRRHAGRVGQVGRDLGRVGRGDVDDC